MNIFTKIQSWLIYLIVILVPVIFIPVLTDPFELGKQSVVLVLLLVLFLIALLSIIRSRQLVSSIQFSKSYLLPLTLLTGVLVLSSLINTPNKIASLAAPGGPAVWLLLTLFFLFAVSANRLSLTASLLTGASLLSLVSIVFTFAPLTYPFKLPFTPVSVGRYFAPAGNLASQILFFAALIPLAISLIYQKITSQKVVKLVPAVVGLILVLAGLVSSIYGMVNSPKSPLLPQNIAWSVALETLKTGRQAVLGFGPGQYINAFTSFKPLIANSSDFWNLRFTASSNWYFQLLTEAGLVGLLILGLLVWSVIRKALLSWRAPTVTPIAVGTSISLLTLIIGLAFLTGNFLIYFFLVVLLVLNEQTEIKAKDVAQLGGFIYPLLVFPLTVWLILAYFGTRQILANNYYYRSLVAANANDGLKTYNLQARTIALDPTSPTYRWAYAQTNFALANAIASQATTEKPLTDQQRNEISQLIQQAIAEAKSTVALDPRSASAWENLAATYRSLINFAEGANDWSIQSYQQAISLDPFNPRIRLDLGGIYFTNKLYPQAANLFAQAASLKPDYANAQYNLANALKEIGNYQESYQAYQNALALVAKDSEDYTKVSAEMAEVQKRLPSPTPTTEPSGQTPGTLTTPENPPTGINPPIEVPQESQPPATE